MDSWTSRRRINVLLISLAFLFIFASAGTLTGLQKVIQQSISDGIGSHEIEGYYLIAGTSFAYSLSLLLCPSLISIVGNRAALFIGSFGMLVYGFVLQSRNVWLSSALSALGGIANGILWVAENNYIVKNANAETLASDISLFWSLYSSSIILGNLCIVIVLDGVTRIDHDSLQLLFYLASGSVCFAVTFLLFLKRPLGNLSKNDSENSRRALAKLFKLAKKKRMLFFYSLFIFNGFQQALGMFVYNASVAFTNRLGEKATQLALVSAVAYAAGLCSAGISSMFLSKFEKRCKYFNAIVYCVGVFELILSSAGIFLNLPNESSFGPTDSVSFTEPMAWLTLICGFGLGLSEGLTSTQIYSLLGREYPDNSAESAACYKIMKGLSVSSFLLIAKYLGLHGLLIVLVFFGLVSSIAFVATELEKM